MESVQGLLLAMIIVAFGTTTHLIQAQPNPNEFISLDCGLHPAASPYTEPLTKLTYTSDANFTQGGQSGRVQKIYEQDYKPFTVLRYFPDGIRNCYNLKVTSGTKYLIKALFLYGNYDGLQNGPKFDMYLGPNIWTTVDLTSSIFGSDKEEIIHIPTSSSLQICLVKTGKTTPFISALELRPLRDDTYNTTSGSLKLIKREFASNDFIPPFIRYPADVYDRQWDPISPSFEFNFVNTSLIINASTPYELPQEVISKAVVNQNVTEKLSFDWYVDDRNDHAFIYLHFAEIQTLRGNDTREFDITWEGDNQNFTVSAYRPPKLQLETLYNPYPMKCKFLDCTVDLVMTKRDLSNNNLSGEVPEFLANMESLLLIDLGWNSLTGPIPQALRDREKKGLKLTKSSIYSKKKRFTYSEVEELTDNFKRVLGEGGFGVVYHGSLSDTEPVAVKVLSESSVQGYKEFKAEVELLLRVHHINLVSLVGYCDEGGHLALIYEYMANGDLKQHLSGESAGSTLKWASRLKIAVEAAQGLEYLHVGCEPPMVHRDVKSTNILLDDRFEAKLADFGLSRSFCVGAETQVATVVAGTPGYLDPEYYQTNWLHEKSDVYSFGIVLMEIITNRSVIELTREKAHIAEWVKILISGGDLEKIVDSNLGGDYDSNTVWKILELAMSCVSHSSSDRPTMPKVVNVLKECLISENSRIRGQVQDDDSKNSLELTVAFGTQVTPDAR
ncbi:probable LRR receptor-like serine/threonine-protein kinase At1g07560 isoform X3 [Raphanus sativus]|uniref:Probable LRR receptor-like serine/threonine-protein kinase At1g07560 isoform X3 n=1 Tax=Raphanus sativus TaxID=3726 RepID=A0A9W3BWU3_RAPSA|nr:probable LRR receptor-like serine/threonine-protein kinase At1g07560 isoform X3 [Raphanus sativus]